MTGNTTIQDLLRETSSKLDNSDSAKLDAEILLAHVLDQGREFLYSHQEFELATPALERFNSLVERRQQGEPIAYITGTREFWGLEFSVTPDVLVPRPETELLVETALDLIAEDSPARVADLGTGSGAIAIALAHSRRSWQVTAVDTSEQALAVARSNAEKHDLENVELLHSSWCEDLQRDSLDLIVANPPYVAPQDPHLQSEGLRYEPIIALQADADGYEDLFAIANCARDHLKPGGWLLMEHGYDQHSRLCEKLLELGYTAVLGKRDLAGHWRMVQAQKPAR